MCRINRHFELNIDEYLKLCWYAFRICCVVCVSVFFFEQKYKCAYVHTVKPRWEKLKMHPDVCVKTLISICLSVPVGNAFFHSTIELIYSVVAPQAITHNIQPNHTGMWSIVTQVCVGKCSQWGINQFKISSQVCVSVFFQYKTDCKFCFSFPYVTSDLFKYD